MYGKPCLALYTTRPVTKGEPITLDLGRQLEELEVPELALRCQCEVRSCRHLLGDSIITSHHTACCNSSCFTDSGRRTLLPPGKTMLHPSLALPSCSSCRDTFLIMAKELEGDEETCRCCGQAPADTDRAICVQCPAVFCCPCLRQMLGEDFLLLARDRLENLASSLLPL